MSYQDNQESSTTSSEKTGLKVMGINLDELIPVISKAAMNVILIVFLAVLWLQNTALSSKLIELTTSYTGFTTILEKQSDRITSLEREVTILSSTVNRTLEK